MRSVATGRHSAAIAAVAVFTLLDAGLYYRAVAPALDATYSLEQPSRLLITSADQPTLFTYRTSAYSLQYYAGRQTHDVKTVAEAATLLSSDAPVVLLTRRRHVDAIRQLATSSLNVWWEGPRSRILLFPNTPPERRRSVRCRVCDAA